MVSTIRSSIICLCMILSLHGPRILTASYSICPPSGDHYFPHEDCTKFIVCSHGYYNEFNCPARTFWNQKVKACRYDSSVCFIPTLKPGLPSTTEEAETTGAPSNGTTQFTEQWRQTTESTTITDASERTTEGDTRSTTVDNPTTDYMYPCPPTGYHTLPHPAVCNLYYRCYEGTWMGVFSCGSELWFDSKRQTCVEPSQSDCPYGD